MLSLGEMNESDIGISDTILDSVKNVTGWDFSKYNDYYLNDMMLWGLAVNSKEKFTTFMEG